MRSLTTIKGSRTLALFAVLTLVPLILLVILPLHQATNALTQEGTNRVKTAATTNADLVARQMQNVSAQVERFNRRPQMLVPVTEYQQGGHPAAPALAEMRSLNPSIRSAFLASVDGQGLVLEPTTRRIPRSAGPQADYFLASLDTTRPVFSGVVTSRAADQAKVFVVAMAVRSPTTGEPVAVMGATFDLDTGWQRYVDDYERNNGMELTLYDNKGAIAATSRSTGANLVGTPAPFIEANTVAFTGTRTVDDEQVIVSHRDDPLSGWGVMATADASTVLAPVRELERSTYLISSILGLVLIAAAFTFLRVLGGRQRAEASLASTESRTRQILETAAQAYVETDRDGRVTEWNKRAEEVFGFTKDEVCGQHYVGRIVSLEEGERMGARIDEAFGAGKESAENLCLQASMLRKDSDEPVPVEITMWRTDVDGASRFSAFVTDITERRRLESETALVVENQNRLVEELREADRVKNDFISTVSHELRTPLTSIVGYLEMFDDGYAGEVTERQASMLSVIDRNSRRLLGLIEDILTLTRIESGTYQPAFAPVDVNELMKNVELTMIPAANEKKLTFEVSAPDVSGAAIRGDYEQLERVLFNLAGNAIKFTPEGGKVCVAADIKDASIRIVVSDTGIGIPLAEQRHLFTRFFRATTANAAAIQGTGLGLTIVKSIVERHGGTIGVESVEAVGTTVTVELPLESVDVKSGAALRR